MEELISQNIELVVGGLGLGASAIVGSMKSAGGKRFKWFKLIVCLLAKEFEKEDAAPAPEKAAKKG